MKTGGVNERSEQAENKSKIQVDRAQWLGVSYTYPLIPAAAAIATQIR